MEQMVHHNIMSMVGIVLQRKLHLWMILHIREQESQNIMGLSLIFSLIRVLISLLCLFIMVDTYFEARLLLSFLLPQQQM